MCVHRWRSSCGSARRTTSSTASRRSSGSRRARARRYAFPYVRPHATYAYPNTEVHSSRRPRTRARLPAGARAHVDMHSRILVMRVSECGGACRCAFPCVFDCAPPRAAARMAICIPVCAPPCDLTDRSSRTRCSSASVTPSPRSPRTRARRRCGGHGDMDSRMRAPCDLWICRVRPRMSLCIPVCAPRACDFFVSA